MGKKNISGKQINWIKVFKEFIKGDEAWYLQILFFHQLVTVEKYIDIFSYNKLVERVSRKNN